MTGAVLSFARIPHRSEFARAFHDGMHTAPKHIASKYFYDAAGSALFDSIGSLPEYYPTRTEMRLLREHADEIAALIGPGATLIEYGAGSPRKAEILLSALERPRAYVPVDISASYLAAAASAVSQKHPELVVRPIVADIAAPLDIPFAGARRAGFFPGSTIGNFDKAEARAFLRHAVATLQGGGLLVGVDLVKEPAVLHAAYNDRAGVTEAFNKNVLARANRELGADFDLDSFSHYAFYNAPNRRIEMHLVSLAEQVVRVDGELLAFREGEAIHTENSYKYTRDAFHVLAAEAGFVPRACWTDANKLFSLHWLEPASTFG